MTDKPADDDLHKQMMEHVKKCMELLDKWLDTASIEEVERLRLMMHEKGTKH